MQKLQKFLWIYSIGLFLALLPFTGCTKGTSLKNLSPVQPPKALPPDIVLDTSNPDQFDEYPAQGPVLSMTQDDVTVAITYWRHADLDRKFNRGNAVSPFYETEALHQGDKTDVFYVKITNNAPRKVIFSVKGTMETPVELADKTGNHYGTLSYDDLKKRLEYMARVGGLYVKNGLDKAREILLEKRLPPDGIPPGKSVEGFLPFYQLKPNTEEFEVVIPLEIEPPEGTAARYKRLVFRFPFTHDRGIRIAQPPPIRY